jgi:hypothetical protein
MSLGGDAFCPTHVAFGILGFFFGQFYQVGKDFASLEDYFGLN